MNIQEMYETVLHECRYLPTKAVNRERGGREGRGRGAYYFAISIKLSTYGRQNRDFSTPKSSGNVIWPDGVCRPEKMVPLLTSDLIIYVRNRLHKSV